MKNANVGKKVLCLLFSVFIVFQAQKAVSVDFANIFDTAGSDYLGFIEQRPEGGHWLLGYATFDEPTYTMMTVFEDAFQDNDVSDWTFPPLEADSPDPGGWKLVEESDEQFVLEGQGHAWAYPSCMESPAGFSNLSLRIRLEEGAINIYPHYMSEDIWYMMGLRNDFVYVYKYMDLGTVPSTEVWWADIDFSYGQWYDVEIRSKLYPDGGTIGIYLDGELVLSAVDEAISFYGNRIALEVLGNIDEGWTSHVYLDDIVLKNRALCNKASLVVGESGSGGDILSSKLYETDSSMIGSAIASAGNGGFYVAGSMLPPCISISTSDVFVAKIGADGALNWAKRIGNEEVLEFAGELVATADGGVIVTITGGHPELSCETTPTYSVGYYDIILIKFDSEGNITWKKAFGGQYQDYGHLAPSADGNLILYGTSSSFDGWNALVMKLDPSGNTIWQRLLVGEEYDAFVAAQETTGGDFLLAGSTQSQNPDPFNHYGDILLARFDCDGNLVWQKVYGSASYSEGVSGATVGTSAGDVLFRGFRSAWNIDFTDYLYEYFWMKMSPDGVLQWVKNSPLETTSVAELSLLTRNQDALVVGGSWARSGDSDWLFVGVNEDLESSLCPLFTQAESLQGSPAALALGTPAFVIYNPQITIIPVENVTHREIKLNTSGICELFGCWSDVDHDGDVDGSDLAIFAEGNCGATIEQMSLEFGNATCF